jgi:pentatricopeptide repeat protein
MRLLITVILILVSAGSLGEEEPSASKEPSAQKEPSADKEPSASKERSATNLDSLAAAYARVGEFDRALQVVNEILADEILSSSARTKYTSRIDRYNNGIPFQL